MRLTKRAYAFLCRQYRLILQQNHLANAMCRGLMAGVVGVTLAVGSAHATTSLPADWEITYTRGDDSAYTVTKLTDGADTSGYLDTFTVIDADGNSTTYGITLKDDSTIAGAVKDALDDDYTVKYDETTERYTVVMEDGGTLSPSTAKLTSGTYTGQQIGQTKSTGTSVYLNNGYYFFAVFSNSTTDTTVAADFVNNTTSNISGNYPRAAGGALYNGPTSNTVIGGTATISSITGDFIGNTATTNSMYGYGGAIANMTYNEWTATIGDITGNFIANTASGSGGAIYTSGSSGSASIGDITGDFIGNTAQNGTGGAIYSLNSSIGNITGNFIGNTAYGNGGAIYYFTNTIAGTITGDFVANVSATGSGGAIYNYSTIGDENTDIAIAGDFVANTAQANGGAIANDGATLNFGIINGDIVGNFYGNESTIGSGGAIYNAGTINGDIIGDFYANTAYISGGAIYNDTGDTIGDITGDFSSNVATTGSGGAIYSNGYMGSIEGDFAYNSAGVSGGAIYMLGTIGDDDTSYITGNFTNNTAGSSGGAVYLSVDVTTFTGDFSNNSVSNSAENITRTISEGYGGALYNIDTIGTLEGSFTSNSVTNSTTSSKSGYSATLDSYANGGAIYSAGDIGSIDGDFEKNTTENESVNEATNGAKVYIYANGGAIYSAGDIGSIIGNFTDNTTTNTSVNTVDTSSTLVTTAAGGAIYNTGTVGTIDGDFSGNQAINNSTWTGEGSVQADALGGAIYNAGKITEITGDFTDNIAGTSGGAIYNTGTISAISGNFTGNSADDNGGAVYTTGSITFVAKAEDSFQFTNNVAGDEYNAIYVYGASTSAGTIPIVSFTMGDNSTFTVNDSILGEKYFTVSISGVDTSSVFNLNDALADNTTTSSSNNSTLSLNAVTLALGTYDSHTDTTITTTSTSGSITVDSVNISGKTNITMAAAANTIVVSDIAIANGAVVTIDTTAIASDSAGNVKTGTLTMGTLSMLNLTGDTFMDVSSSITIASATVNVGDGDATDVTKLSVKGITATDNSTITVTGAGSSFTGTSSVSLDNSEFYVLAGAEAEFTSLTATNGSSLLVDGAGSELTSSGAIKLDASTFTVSDSATVDFTSLLAENGSTITVTGTYSELTGSGAITLDDSEFSVLAGADAEFTSLTATNDSTIKVTGASSSITGTSSASLNNSDFSVSESATASFTSLTATNGSSLLVDGTGSSFTTTSSADATFSASPLTVTDSATATFGQSADDVTELDDDAAFTGESGGGASFSAGSNVIVSGGAEVTFGNAFKHDHNETSVTHYTGDISFSNSTLSVTGDNSNFQAGELTMTGGELSVDSTATVDFYGDAVFTDSPIFVTGVSTASVCGDASFTNSDVTVTDGSTAIFGAYFYHVHDTGDTTITAHYDGVLTFVDSDITVTGDGTTLYAGSATINNGTLTLSEGATINMGKGGIVLSNSTINVISEETSTDVAALNLHDDLELSNSTINVTNGADLDIYFYETGATIEGAEGTINTINVTGEGSTLHVSLENGEAEATTGYFQNIILNILDGAIFEIEGLNFSFTGAIGKDDVVNLAVTGGAHAMFEDLAVTTADISILGTSESPSAFVAQELVLDNSTITVFNSYAQVDTLTATVTEETTVRRSTAAVPTETTENLLGGDDSSDLRVAAGGIFVLGEMGEDNDAKETTAEELLLGLIAANDDTEGASNAVTGSWAALNDGDDQSYGFSIDEDHSAFVVTNGATLTISSGSSLIIDADAGSLVEDGANDYLLDNVALYIGHDDFLLVDYTDPTSYSATDAIITIEASDTVDTAYILAADSKIRVIVKNDALDEEDEGTQFIVIYDENHANDEAHQDEEYTGDIYFVLNDVDDLGNTNVNYFATCSHVEGDSSYIDDNRITMKTAGTIVITDVTLAELDGIDADDAGDATYTVYEFSLSVEGYKNNFGVEDELFASLVEFYKANDSALQSADDATRFLTKTTVYATEANDRDAAIKLGSVTEIAVVGGVAAMATDAMTTTTDALGRYLDYGINATGAYDEKGSFSLWGIPLYSQSTVDGIKVGSIEGGYEQELIAGIMGIDISNTSGRVGVSFATGLGESSSTQDFLQTETDTDFYGAALYGQYKFGALALRADLGYYVTESSIDQESCGYSDFSNVTADVDTTIMTAGFDASYLLSFNENWALKPHAGARYSVYNQDSFTSQVNGNDFFTTEDADMTIISVPFGVSLLTNFNLGDWTIQPRVDASIIFNFGDTSVENNVSAPSLQSFGTANIEADILDEYTMSGSIGVDAAYGKLSIGLDYNMQQSDRRTAHGIFGTIRYAF